MAYGAPGRVAMPQRLRPKDKDADVAEAIQEMLDEDQTAAQKNPILTPQEQFKQASPEPSEDSDEHAESEHEEQEEQEQEDGGQEEDEEEAVPEEEEMATTSRREGQQARQSKPLPAGAAFVAPSRRADLGFQPDRSFSTEAKIAAEARIRRPRVSLRTRLRRLQSYLMEQWSYYNGQAVLDYLAIFAKVFFITAVVILSYQSLRPYLPTVRLSPLPRLRSPFGPGLVPETKVIFDNRPLSALEDLVTHQYNLIQTRVDYIERSYAHLAKSVNVVPPTRKVNFFALGSGVVIDPYLTSPTRYVKQRSIINGAFNWLRGLPPKSLPPPFMALTAWDDMGDCWCAPDSGGKSQLALELNQMIVPQELVVEHISMAATLDAGATPRDIELWVQIKDPERRQAVAKAALYYHITSQQGDNQKTTYSTTRSLDDTWVRIGRWQYNLFDENNIQTFQVPVPLDHFNAPVKKLAIRTLSNWGKVDYVCLYRLKLHGLVATDGALAAQETA